jgi:hypothetical protein
VLTKSGDDLSHAQRLPDGSWLKIVSISYGHTHSYNMPRPKPWQSFLLKQLPASWSARLGLWQGTGGVGSSARPGETNLAIFTVCKQAAPSSLCLSAQIDVLDEHARKLGTAFVGPTSGNSDGKHLRQLVCWTLDSDIPHDSKRLVLRFSEVATNSRSRQQVAEFVIPNPAAGTHKQVNSNGAASGAEK